MAFHGFPDLPASGETAFCKIDGVYCCGNAQYGDITTFTNATKNHPKINVTFELLHHRTTDENLSMYVDVEDNNLLKKITSVWYQQGFIEALSVAADRTVNRDSPVLAQVAACSLKIANVCKTLRHIVQPHLKDIGPKIIANYSLTRSWSSAPVKAIAWHPHALKIAVAMADDSVRVYCKDAIFISCLKCKAQGHISSLSWRPLSASEIAVGCEQGVIVWTVDPNSMFTKPSSSNATILKRPGHTPVTDVSWSPNGDILVSCSGADTSMLVWDVALETSVALKRVAGGGVVFARWSPDGSKLFAATTSLVFRIWETRTWSADRWCARGGRVVAACWGPNNKVLFASYNEPIVYAINNTGLMQGSSNAISQSQPVLDVTKVELPSGETVGGAILDMCWDNTGRYLAIMFMESSLIAIFCTTQLMLQMQFTPCCFVNGLNNETPLTMAFQQNFKDGACLTIIWSSGRTQHFPIIFTEVY